MTVGLDPGGRYAWRRVVTSTSTFMRGSESPHTIIVAAGRASRSAES